MKRGFWAAVNRVLAFRIAGRMRDELEPQGETENEFPLYCMNCGSKLRALTTGCCRKCGKPFDRDWSLVEQYALGRQPENATDRRVSLWCLLAGPFFVFIPSTVLKVLSRGLDHERLVELGLTTDAPSFGMLLLVGFRILGWMLIAVSGALTCLHVFRTRKQRKLIIEALRAMREAQFEQ